MAAKKTAPKKEAAVEEVEEVEETAPASLVEGSTFASRAKARNKRVGNGSAVKK